MKKILYKVLVWFDNNINNSRVKKESQRQKHNAKILQNLLNCEHTLRDLINQNHNQVFTTKRAIEYANKIKFANYNSQRSLDEADFR